MTDILHRLSNEEIDELIKQYKAALPHSLMGYIYLLSAKRICQTSEGNDLIDVYGADNLENYTFIGVDRIEPGFHIYIYTLDPTWDHAEKCIRETNLIDWTKERTMFLAVHEQFLNKLQNIFKLDSEDVDYPVPVFWLDIDKALAYDATIDCGYYFDHLKPKDAIVINDVWAHKEPGSEKYVETLIRISGGYGIYSKQNNQLVAWALRHNIGTMGLVQVDEKYQRQGLGSAIVKYISKQLVSDGIIPSGTVVFSNAKSMSMYTKLGFVRAQNNFYIHVVSK